MGRVSMVVIGTSEAVIGAASATELTVTVPADLTADLHDVTVATADGRWSVLTGGFEISP